MYNNESGEYFMKNVVKKSLIFVSIIAIFAYIIAPDTANNYETSLDIHVKQINVNKSK